MSQDNLLVSTVKMTPYMARLSVSLLWTYMTLGYRVRRTRRAFEKQLIAQGMSKKDARQLSACYDDLKNSITAMVRQGFAGGVLGNRQ